LSTFPEAVAIGISSQLVAKLYPRVGPRRLMVGGFVGLAAVTTLLAQADLTTSLWDIRALTFFLGVAVSFILLSNQASAFAKISSAETGHAAAIFNTLQRALSSLGIAVLSVVLATAGGGVLHVRPPISAFHWVFGANAVLALLGAAVALSVNDADAASTMGREAPEPVEAPA
ncbi:MAG: MFS transporter, partial [Acidimicrobiales bacterium]